MYRKTLNYLSFAFALVLLVSFAKPEQKLDKLVSKIWKDQVIELVEVQLPDSMKTRISHFAAIKSGDQLLGYGCYTTAFGCRVGGCAAPGEANVEAYETFDYIVIYDQNMAIIQVDIAEYGGQYGYEICRAKWLDQFAGKNSGFVLDDNIDGITGATVSASYLIDDLNDMGKTLAKLLQDKAI